MIKIKLLLISCMFLLNSIAFSSASYTIINNTGEAMYVQHSSCMKDSGSSPLENGFSTNITDSNAFFGGCAGGPKSLFWSGTDGKIKYRFTHKSGAAIGWKTFVTPSSDSICIDKDGVTYDDCSKGKKNIQTVIFGASPLAS